MYNSILVVARYERSHRDDVLGIVVFDGSQVAKLPFPGLFIRDEVRGLYVNPPSIGMGTYEIDLSGLQLPDINRITQTDKMLVDDIFYHLFDVAFASPSCHSIPNTWVFKIIFVIAFEDSSSVDIVTVYLPDYIGFTQKRQIVKDNR